MRPFLPPSQQRQSTEVRKLVSEDICIVVLCMIMCWQRGAGCLHMDQPVPSPSKNPIIFLPLLKPAYRGCPRKEAIKWVVYSFTHPTDGARGIMFWGCPSVCACVPGWMHSPTGSPSITSDLLCAIVDCNIWPGVTWCCCCCCCWLGV